MSKITNGIAGWPLHWPDSWTRTPPHLRRSSRFDTSLAAARDGLLHELRLMGARSIVVSSYLELRQDGLPRSNQRMPGDPGVAVWFERKDRQQVIACDCWDRIEDNLQAARRTVEAMRGLERWGATEMLDRMFRGFVALPPPERPWWSVLGVAEGAPIEVAEAAYRALARQRHPDVGGTEGAFRELSQAIEAARAKVTKQPGQAAT